MLVYETLLKLVQHDQFVREFILKHFLRYVKFRDKM